MTLDEVQKHIQDLDWSNPENVQLSAIEHLVEIDDELTPLLIQDMGKPCWHNAVIVLHRIGYPRNRFSIPRLIWLMQDLNWPGVPLAIEVMKNMDKAVVIPPLEHAIHLAFEEEDFDWMAGLKEVTGILGIGESDFKNEQSYRLLDLAEW